MDGNGASPPGVAAEDLPHVCDRFYQADPARDRSTGTSGVGLAAENDPDGGARFWIELDQGGGVDGVLRADRPRLDRERTQVSIPTRFSSIG